ncbi:SWIM zinc finger family protein [Streptomyces sp. NPDC001851]|uniref:SWIM zinc finger family protein n=1 Tax=Streptomyces sp. NPDC001851 TaxID=3154529 RepID=UPI00332AFAF4
MARAALRAAVSARRSEREAPTTAAVPRDRRDDGVQPASAPPVAAPAPAGARSPGQDGAPDHVGTVPQARSADPAGGRPADIAREALRAARREALRAEADESAGRGTPAGEPRVRRHARVTGAPGSPAPRTGSVSGPDAASRAARLNAAQEMRHYLANAFRMPTWSDTPEDDTGTIGTGDTAGTTAGSAEPRPAPADPAGCPMPTGPAAPHTPPATATPTTRGRSAPASPHVPPTMATPHRDTELRRTFAAFASREAGAEEGPFAATWWGNAWAEALEQGALDPKRLARGRGYADQGHVDAITVTPGLVLAYVRGSRPRPYRVQVRVRTLEDEDWERFLDAAADLPGHIAALLDKELPHSLADCGVPLLPGPGDLVPRCSCPDSGHPCKHAAALCYQTARLIDADPFVLLLLRGRGEKDLLDALSRRSAARAARAAHERQPQSLPGVRATDALAPRALPPLPPPLPAPPHPEQPPVYPAAPGGPDPFALDQLATDAAARAHALLGTGRDPVGELTLWQDAVRLAAARPGSGLTATTRTLYAALATAAGRTPADLARAVAAWRQGGLAGLAVLEEPWDPPAGRFDRARPLLLAADLPVFRPWRNRLTHPRGHVQLRLGRDGLWYAYESEPGHDDWWPRGTPDLDPVGALTGLGTPDAT